MVRLPERQSRAAHHPCLPSNGEAGGVPTRPAACLALRAERVTQDDRDAAMPLQAMDLQHPAGGDASGARIA